MKPISKQMDLNDRIVIEVGLHCGHFVTVRVPYVKNMIAMNWVSIMWLGTAVNQIILLMFVTIVPKRNFVTISINSSPLSVHTFVPCANPYILTKSKNFVVGITSVMSLTNSPLNGRPLKLSSQKNPEHY